MLAERITQKDHGIDAPVGHIRGDLGVPPQRSRELALYLEAGPLDMQTGSPGGHDVELSKCLLEILDKGHHIRLLAVMGDQCDPLHFLHFL